MLKEHFLSKINESVKFIKDTENIKLCIKNQYYTYDTILDISDFMIMKFDKNDISPWFIVNHQFAFYIGNSISHDQFRLNNFSLIRSIIPNDISNEMIEEAFNFDNYFMVELNAYESWLSQFKDKIFIGSLDPDFKHIGCSIQNFYDDIDQKILELDNDIYNQLPKPNFAVITEPRWNTKVWFYFEPTGCNIFTSNVNGYNEYKSKINQHKLIFFDSKYVLIWSKIIDDHQITVFQNDNGLYKKIQILSFENMINSVYDVIYKNNNIYCCVPPNMELIFSKVLDYE